MNARDKQYKKLAKLKAKEYLRKRRGYKTKQEKKAFKLAERYRIREWKASLSMLDEAERSARLSAFRYYRMRLNILPLLIGCACAVVLLVLAVIILL